jgi:hypothetical protein
MAVYISINRDTATLCDYPGVEATWLTAGKGFKGKDRLPSRPYLETIGSEAKSPEN